MKVNHFYAPKSLEEADVAIPPSIVCGVSKRGKDDNKSIAKQLHKQVTSLPSPLNSLIGACQRL
jgi:hypothetical protein